MYDTAYGGFGIFGKTLQKDPEHSLDTVQQPHGWLVYFLTVVVKEEGICRVPSKKEMKAPTGAAGGTYTRRPSRRWLLRGLGLTASAVWLSVMIWAVLICSVSFNSIFAWSLSQWWPVDVRANPLLRMAWNAWSNDAAFSSTRTDITSLVLNIPVVNVQEQTNVEEYLIQTYGEDWRSRPLLLRGLWDEANLGDPSRRLSITGLLKENMTIPYISDSTLPYALSPDAHGPISAIVRNITQGAPHKIGTQFFIQHNAELIHQVGPTKLLSSLFGDHFRESAVFGGKKSIFPGTTTVPIFMANGAAKGQNPATTTTDSPMTGNARPSTGLHAEPIGNIAVQLAGSKKWTLVTPEHSFRLKPTLAPDGRAFFASFLDSLEAIPRYSVTTCAGDAVWVPTWTWHRVDYDDQEGVAFGASLFHFRPVDFLSSNPLFAALILPALVKELLGITTQ